MDILYLGEGIFYGFKGNGSKNGGFLEKGHFFKYAILFN